VCSTHFLDTAKGIVTARAFGFLAEDRDKNTRLVDTSQRPAYLLQMIQNWLSLVLGLLVMGMCTVLTTLTIKFRSSSGFAGASMVTLMGLGSELTYLVLYLTQLETSLGAISGAAQPRGDGGHLWPRRVLLAEPPVSQRLRQQSGH
jgi:hypothetical protein